MILYFFTTAFETKSITTPSRRNDAYARLVDSNSITPNNLFRTISWRTYEFNPAIN